MAPHGSVAAATADPCQALSGSRFGSCGPGLAAAALCVLCLSTAAALATAPADRASSASGPLTLAVAGQTDYRIVVAAQASPATRYGATELRGFLREMTGADFAIVDDTAPPLAHEILLGDSARLRSVGITINAAALGSEGYVLRTVDGRLVIAGGAERGDLYGVYGLLEDHLGCRWYTVEISSIPRVERLELPALDETVVPPLEYREILMSECYDGDWAARNRLNGLSARLGSRHGGGEGVWGVHTFYRWVPPERYFASHPEYFALVDGKRAGSGAQLCLAQPQVFELILAGVREAMRQYPQYTAYSVSQNDCAGPCQCPQCRAIAEREGSEMGPVLDFVNRIAAAVEPEFPGKCISTLAYQYTRRPPQHLRPRRNVVVQLCSIEANFGAPLADPRWPQNRAFVQDLESWARIHDRLYIWNYTTSFAAYLTPYPNRHAVGPDLRLFVANHVRGVFEQNVYNTLGGEMSELDAFLLAKLLWNPQVDRQAVADDFLTHVYGRAAAPIRAYLELIERHVVDDGIVLSFNMPPGGDLLTPALLQQGDTLWEQAEAAVRYQPEVLARVQRARMCLDYAFVQLALSGGFAAWRIDQQNLVLRPDPVLADRLDRFVAQLDRTGVDRLTEWGVTKKEFVDSCSRLRQGERRLPLVAAEDAPRQGDGLAYTVYPGGGAMLGDRTLIEGLARGTTADITTGLAPGTVGYGVVFSGYLEAPRDGIYTFSMVTDDAGYLRVGDEEVIANRDTQQWGVRQTGYIALAKGRHRLEAAWYNLYGAEALRLEWTVPEGTSTPLPAALLSH